MSDENSDGDEDTLDLLRRYGEVWDGKTPPLTAYEREVEIAKIVEQIDEVGRSFLLLGESGTGKTLIIQNAIHQLCSRSTQPWRVIETSTSFLVAGKKYIGEWQGVIHAMIKLAKRSERIAIWFTDLMYLVSAGRSDGSEENMGSAMASLIDRREILLLGECTPETYKSNLEPHASFTRLLDKIRIEPLSFDASRRVLQETAAHRAALASRQRGRGLRWSHEALELANYYGELYFPGISRPAGAIRLLETASKESALDPFLDAATNARQSSVGDFEIPGEAIIQALTSVTGAPRKMLDDTIPLELNEVRRFFESKLVGQRTAINTVIDLIALIKAGLTDPLKPLGVLMFVGPTGVGKTELARAMAEFIFGGAERLIRLDMSEYQEYGAVEKLVGRPHLPDPPGGLLAHVRQQPFSVVLLDEIEKAHPSIFDLLLQLFDAGRLTRASGETINFTQTVIILTSNLGASNPEPPGFGFVTGPADSVEEQTRNAVQQFFRPELVNRIGHILPFDHLTRDEVRVLAMREIGAVLMRSGITRRKLQVDVDRGVVDVVAEAGYDPKFGARPLKRAVERLVLAPLARFLSEMDVKCPPSLIQLYPTGGAIRLRAIFNERAQRQQVLPTVKRHDPIDGKSVRIDRNYLGEKFAELENAVGDLDEDFNQRGLTGRREAYVAATGAADFWDDPARARETLADFYKLDRLQEAIYELRTHSRDLGDRIQRLGSQTPLILLQEIATELERNLRQSSLVRFALLCDSALQRSDAFVVIEAVDPSSGSQAERLANSYALWAKRLGFNEATIHEELFPNGELKESVLQIEGVAVYGALAGEQGLHEFATSDESTRMLVKLTVMPILEGSVKESDIEVTSQPIRKRGKRLASLRTTTTATYRPSGQRVRIQSDKDGSAAQSHARELLIAELNRQKRLAISAESAISPIVRRWWLGKQPHARDPRTDTTVRRLKDLDAGFINPFLLAWLQQNNPNSLG